jgi:hypothetical protein
VAPEESCGACCSRDCCCTATQVGAGLLGVGVAFFAPWGANMLGVLKTNMAININIAEAIVGGIGSCYGLTVGHRH